MKRDFSQAKIEELRDDISDYTSKYLQGLGQIVDFDDMDILEAVVCTKAVENFEKQLEEKEILSASKLVEIITNVKELDKTFGEYLETLNEQLDAYDKRIQSVIEMLKPEKLSMNNLEYLNEILKIGKEYQTAKDNSELIKVELWLNSNYKLSDEELAQAQGMLDEYFAEGTDAANLTRDQRYGIELRDRWSSADWEKFELMSSLRSKVGSYESYMVGVAEDIPFYGAFADWSGELHAEILGYDFNKLCYSDNVFANSHTQHPFITFGGNVTGNVLMYMMASEIAGSIPGLHQGISNVSGRISTFPVLRWIGEDHLTNIIGGTLIETGISTIPGMLKDAWNGESAENVFRNAGLDIGRNLLFNIGGEAISGAIGKVLKKAPETVQKIFSNTIEENTDDVAEGVLKGGSEAIPDKARDIAKQVKGNNGAPPKGYKGGRTYKNIPLEDGAQKLPEGVNYKEYDIDPYVKGQNRGAERIVIGDDGSVWYTNDHYYTFIQIE